MPLREILWYPVCLHVERERREEWAGRREGENIVRVKAFVLAPRDGDSVYLVTEY